MPAGKPTVKGHKRNSNLLLIIFKCPLGTSIRAGDGRDGGVKSSAGAEMEVAGDELPLHPRLGCEVVPPDAIPFPHRSGRGGGPWLFPLPPQAGLSQGHRTGWQCHRPLCPVSLIPSLPQPLQPLSTGEEPKPGHLNHSSSSRINSVPAQ